MKSSWPVPSLAVLVLALACASAPPPPPTNLALGDPARRDRALAVQANVILDARGGDRLDVDTLAARLEGKRLVFFGETHAQPAVQAGERQLLDALARRGRRVLVGLEMLPASVQPALDRWVRGEGSEDDLIRDSHWYRHWGFHFGYYRDLFLFARQARTPMVALNVEREVITSVRKAGFDGLAPTDRAKLPAQVNLASEEHRQLFTAFMGGAHSGMTPAEMEGMFRAQCTWDAVMGHNAVKALAAEKDPRAVMVVMVGFGHVAYGLGVERQAALLGGPPAASVVAMAAVDDQGRPASVRASLGDFLWGTPADSEVPAFPSLGASLSDKPGSAAGPTVTTVRAGSPAQKAGVLKDDVVAAVDGQTTADKEAVLIKVGTKSWGDQLAIDVVRGGQRQTLTAILARPAPPTGSN
jgi:uncharacterized iron-regulated protein